MTLDKHFSSKKWTMSLMGFFGVILIHLSSVVLCIISPIAAQHIVALSNITIVFMGSLVGAYTVGQSFVDWRYQGSVNAQYQNQHVSKDIKVSYDSSIEHRYRQENAGEIDYPPEDWTRSYEKQ